MVWEVTPLKPTTFAGVALIKLTAATFEYSRMAPALLMLAEA